MYLIWSEVYLKFSFSWYQSPGYNLGFLFEDETVPLTLHQLGGITGINC